MFKAPQRKTQISQTFNSGQVQIYAVSDGAQPGYLPKAVLSPKLTLRYEERKLGLSRYYEGLQNQLKIERVIRVPHTGEVSSQDVAIDEQGRQYRIDLVQLAPDTYPLAADLSLIKIAQNYEVVDL